MADASVVDQPWVEIVAPVAPADDTGLLWLGAAGLALAAASLVAAWRQRQPHRRARRGLMQLSRDLADTGSDPRAVADGIVRQLRLGLAQEGLERLRSGDGGEYLARLDRYRFAAAPASVPQLRDAIDRALRCLDGAGGPP